MRFLLDECCNVELALSLRKEGHDVLYVTESNPSISDREVLQISYSENRILITEDKDFGELVYRFKLKTQGVILLRFSISDRHLKWTALKKLVDIKSKDLKGKFVVVDKDKYRIRHLN